MKWDRYTWLTVGAVVTIVATLGTEGNRRGFFERKDTDSRPPIATTNTGLEPSIVTPDYPRNGFGSRIRSFEPSTRFGLLEPIIEREPLPDWPINLDVSIPDGMQELYRHDNPNSQKTLAVVLAQREWNGPGYQGNRALEQLIYSTGNNLVLDGGFRQVLDSGGTQGSPLDLQLTAYRRRVGINTSLILRQRTHEEARDLVKRLYLGNGISPAVLLAATFPIEIGYDGIQSRDSQLNRSNDYRESDALSTNLERTKNRLIAQLEINPDNPELRAAVDQYHRDLERGVPRILELQERIFDREVADLVDNALRQTNPSAILYAPPRGGEGIIERLRQLGPQSPSFRVLGPTPAPGTNPYDMGFPTSRRMVAANRIVLPTPQNN